jgi:hypothetical protein
MIEQMYKTAIEYYRFVGAVMAVTTAVLMLVSLAQARYDSELWVVMVLLFVPVPCTCSTYSTHHARGLRTACVCRNGD